MAKPARPAFVPKNEGQRQLKNAVDTHPITLAIGPAGTGKTYGAAAIAYGYYKSKWAHQIWVCRPTIGAGEKNGLLPGTIDEKLGPFMAPVYDALFDIAGESFVNSPDLGFVAFEHMRGRTFENAIVLVDEIQNCTLSQLELVLTRLGKGSKMILTGDPAQSDLNGRSGLPPLIKIFAGSDLLPIVHFTIQDNMRHPVITELLKLFCAYHASVNK